MSANYGNISAYFHVTLKHFEAALIYLSRIWDVLIHFKILSTKGQWCGT